MKRFSSKALDAAMVLTVGQVAGQGLSFARNLMLARYLTKADYGLASAFAFSIALLELTGRMALGQQVVQARDGGDAGFQRNAQAFQLGAGAVSALLLGLASHLLARMLHVPGQAWAFALLALVPLCLGLEHLDMYRFQRELNFKPGVICEFVPQLVITLGAWPLLRWLGDYRVILWLVIGKAVLSVTLTHLLAERSFRVAWDQGIAARIVTFSWPLLVNGLFLFAAQQADQLIVGARYSLEQLAQYAVPVSILMVPWILFAKVVGPVMTSVLSGAQERRAEFLIKSRLCLQLSATATILLTLPLIVCGEQIAAIVFGGKYTGIGPLMAILAAASAFRFVRTAPTAVAIALGDTRNLMWGNVARSISLPLALGVVFAGWSIEWVAGCAVFGEAVALLASLILMAARHALPLPSLLRPVIFTFACLVASAAVYLLGAPNWPVLAAVAASTGLALFSTAAAYGLFSELREYLQQRWVGRLPLVQTISAVNSQSSN